MHTVDVHHVCHDIVHRVSYGSLFSANIDSQRTLSVRYFTTLSQQMLTAVKHVVDDSVVSSTSCMQRSQTTAERTLNFTSFNDVLRLGDSRISEEIKHRLVEVS